MSDRRTGVLASAVLSLILLSAGGWAQQAQNYQPALTISARDLAAPSKAAKEFKRGYEAGSKTDWPSAIKHFHKAIVDYPQYASAYNDLGVSYDKTGDSEAALTAFRDAIRLDDHFSAAYVNMARELAKQNRWSDAKPFLIRVLSSDPRNGDALLVLSYLNLSLHEYDQAAANAAEATNVNPSQYVLAYYVAALAMQAKGQVGEARAQYLLYLQQSPNGPLARQAQAELQEIQLVAK